jgi:prevent-host-death family protein
MQINVLEAKTNLSKLIERALQGEEVVLARHGVPAVRPVPVSQLQPKRLLGLGMGTVKLEADFEQRTLAPLSESELDAWS